VTCEESENEKADMNTGADYTNASSFATVLKTVTMRIETLSVTVSVTESLKKV